ncbi:MAG TPA: POTRA domain-containing protein [Anaeromyxobacteraceae bacterium]|nr:POTRA domain-containing protein [Anaeromyxobacteraceae bacterium]
MDGLMRLLAALAAALFLAPAAGRAEETPLVAEVALEAPPGEDRAALEPLLAVKVGEPLSPRALRRTVLTLYQLGRFGNVVVRAIPLEAIPGQAPRVKLLVQCLPRRVVGRVTISASGGAPAIGAEAASRGAGLREGEELYAGRLEAAAEALRAAYARKGWRAAKVRASAEGEPVAQVALRVEEGGPTRAASVVLGPDPGLGPEALRSLGTRPGAVLDLDVVDEDLRSLQAALRQEGFLRATAGPPSVEVEGERARVDFGVRAGARIAFAVRGARSFSEAELRQHLGLEEELRFDEPALEAAAERLRAFLAARGFARAKVEVSESGDQREREIRFQVDEGRRYRLGQVRILGETSRGEAWFRGRLMELLGEQVRDEPVPGRVQLDRLAAAGGAPSPDPVRWTGPTDPRQAYDEPAWERALADLVEGERADGWLQAAVEGLRVAFDAEAGTADVEIRIREGVRTFVDAISFEGNQALSLKDLSRQSKLAPGDPLSLAKVDQTRKALTDLYKSKGYLFARVESDEERSDDGRASVLRFRVQEGPQVKVGKVIVTGNHRTRESVIRGALDLKPGDVYDPEAAALSEAALLGLGVFRSADLRLSDQETPEPVKDLTVEVSERAYQTLTTGLGISTADGPRLTVDYAWPNLFGRALEFTARAKLNYPLVIFRPDLVGRDPATLLEGFVTTGLRWPRPAGLPLAAARIDLIGEHRIQSSYDLTRGAMALTVEALRLGRLAARITYELEVDDVTTPTGYSSAFAFAPTEEARLLFPVGITTLHALRPSVSLDYRDSVAQPRHGWYAEVTVELAHSLGNADSGALFGLLPGSETYINMLKLSGTASTYLPMGKSVLAFQLRAGQVFPLDPRSQTIAPKRFYLGGATTMRGYGEYEMIPEDRRAAAAQQIERCATLASGLGCTPELQKRLESGLMVPSEGGEAFLMLKGELRVPLGGSLEAGFFADVGNLWLDTNQLSVTDLRLNAGLGLRLLTPVGPAAIDVGFIVNPDRSLNEPLVAPHFTIGFF